MRTGSFIVGLLPERTGVLGVSLSVSFSYYYYCCPAKACLAEVEAQVSGFCYQISWFALPKVCAGSVGTDQGKIGGPVGPRDCVDWRRWM